MSEDPKADFPMAGVPLIDRARDVCRAVHIYGDCAPEKPSNALYRTARLAVAETQDPEFYRLTIQTQGDNLGIRLTRSAALGLARALSELVEADEQPANPVSTGDLPTTMDLLLEERRQLRARVRELQQRIVMVERDAAQAVSAVREENDTMRLELNRRRRNEVDAILGRQATAGIEAAIEKERADAKLSPNTVTVPKVLTERAYEGQPARYRDDE